MADAQTLARQAAESIAARIGRGEGFPQRYAYADRPLREEILQEIRGAQGELAAAVTRNGYGSEVLNAARLLFIDVDLPGGGARSPVAGVLGRLLVALFGGGSRSGPASPAPVPASEAEAHAKRQKWLADHPQWGMRVYRTRSGLRYLVTHALFEPGQAESETVMQFLGCDPAYVQLCRAQKSFRARLTPKAWRCGMRPPPGRFPFQDADIEEQMRVWKTEYTAACERWATCALLEVCGNPLVHEGVAPLLQIHDARTRATADLPLA
jgi:hypothetical protein